MDIFDTIEEFRNDNRDNPDFNGRNYDKILNALEVRLSGQKTQKSEPQLNINKLRNLITYEGLPDSVRYGKPSVVADWVVKMIGKAEE